MRLRFAEIFALALILATTHARAESARERLLNSVSEPVRAPARAQYQERRAAPAPSDWGVRTKSYFTESGRAPAVGQREPAGGNYFRPPNPYPDNPTARIGGANNGAGFNSSNLGPVGSSFKPLDDSAGAHLKGYKPTAQSVADGQQAFKPDAVSTAEGFQGFGGGSVMQLGGDLKTPTNLNLGLKVEGLDLDR